MTKAPLPVVTSPPADAVASGDQSKQNNRPLTIAIPPAPLSSSSTGSAPTPSGGTPLSPTGMPLQGILKNKPRTPTGEGIQAPPLQQQHQDPRTAARKESLKSPVGMQPIELPPATTAVMSTPGANARPPATPTKPNAPMAAPMGARIPVIGGSNTMVRPPVPTSHDQSAHRPPMHPQRPDVRQPWISRVSNTNAEPVSDL